MRALAAYILRGPVQAILVTVALALVSLIPVLGMVSVLSGAAVALVALRQSIRQAMVVMVGASLIAGVFMYFILGTAAVALVFTLLLWLPLLVLAMVLRNTGSWSMLLDAAAAIGALGVVAFYLAMGEPVLFWVTTLGQVLEVMSAQGGLTEIEMIQAQIPLIAEWMTGMLAAALVLGLVLSMMLARWWQALLFNPGGFMQEFYGLRQSRVAALVVLVILALGLVDLGQISHMAGDIMITLVVVYSMVGLALVHALVAKTGKHSAWLVGLYVLLFILPPQMMMALTSVGIIDSWMNFRERFPAAKK